MIREEYASLTGKGGTKKEFMINITNVFIHMNGAEVRRVEGMTERVIRKKDLSSILYANFFIKYTDKPYQTILEFL